MTPSQQEQLEMHQFKDFLSTYNRLSEICFADCVNDFTSRNVTSAEDKCMSHCVEKFLKITQRASQRLQEHQALQMEAMGAPSMATPNT